MPELDRLQAYQLMFLIRAFEQELERLFLEGLLPGTTHLCIGQEACAVGVCMALCEHDVLFSNHRGHGHLLARGADPARIMAEIFGNPQGYSQGRGGSQHIAVPDIGFLGTHGITAGTIPIAAGVALHKKNTKSRGCAVVFFGDGAVNEGVFHETLNMASLWKLPLLLVCENNGYAMSTAFRKASPVPAVATRAVAYAIEADTVDGNDVEAVFKAAQKYHHQCEEGEGPVLLELQTYRMSGHSRGDRCLYRTREEEAEWQKRDPIVTLENKLLHDGTLTPALKKQIENEIHETIEASKAFARERADQ